MRARSFRRSVACLFVLPAFGACSTPAVPGETESGAAVDTTIAGSVDGVGGTDTIDSHQDTHVQASDSGYPPSEVAESDGGGDSDVVVPYPGGPCDDGNACTGPDTWSAMLVCDGPAIQCDDGRACTQDHCYQKVGCTHVGIAGCEQPCLECPTALGFACDETVDPPVCVREATDEAYIPSGLFWFGFNAKVMNSPELGGWLEEDEGTSYRMFLPGFIIDRHQIDSRSYYDFAGVWSCPYSEPVPCNEGAGLPITGFSPVYTQQYCESLGKRLCWESEWEKSAVGGCAQFAVREDEGDACRAATRLYPWGDVKPKVCTYPEKYPYPSVGYCDLPADDEGQTLPNVSVFGVWNMINGDTGEGTLGVASTPRSEHLEHVIGNDGIVPPGVPRDNAASLAFWNDHPLAAIVGWGWLPSFALHSLTFDYLGRAPSSARCCTTVDPAVLVPPGEEPPWPPELQ